MQQLIAVAGAWPREWPGVVGENPSMYAAMTVAATLPAPLIIMQPKDSAGNGKLQ